MAGPIIKSLYKNDFAGGEHIEHLIGKQHKAPKDADQIINYVYDYCKDFYIGELILISHGEAWKKAQGGYNISIEDIKSEFKNKIIKDGKNGTFNIVL